MGKYRVSRNAHRALSERVEKLVKELDKSEIGNMPAYLQIAILYTCIAFLKQKTCLSQVSK